jgi:hypothetical protein
MGAIRPNKNFDNERKEHVSYQDLTMKKLKEAYDNFKKPENQERFRAGGVRNRDSSKKWFGL